MLLIRVLWLSVDRSLRSDRFRYVVLDCPGAHPISLAYLYVHTPFTGSRKDGFGDVHSRVCSCRPEYRDIRMLGRFDLQSDFSVRQIDMSRVCDVNRERNGNVRLERSRWIEADVEIASVPLAERYTQPKQEATERPHNLIFSNRRNDCSRDGVYQLG